MHGVRLDLLKQQAYEIGLLIHIIALLHPCSNVYYQKIMARFIVKIQADNIQAVAFGDLYLEGIKAYRTKQMNGTGTECIIMSLINSYNQLEKSYDI